MKLSPFGTAVLLILAAAAFVSVVSAIPALPHAFCGDVVVNGAPAPDGTEVSATISEGTLVTGTQNPVTTVGGSFGKGGADLLLVQGEIPNGAIITFHVNGVPTDTTGVFEAGGGPTTIRLSVTTGATPLPTTSESVSSGGGGGGGDDTTTAPTEVPEKTVTAEPGGETVTREMPASPAATTPAVAEEPSAGTQEAARTTAPRETPLVYAPIATIAGVILIFAWTRRQ
ncbi:MAG: hypothetical protein HQQ74_09260 [Methanoculleus bourgensis]|jgi:hypothetical protein|uniref:PGF-CTERM sorting domain-containing protein n=1 Tax=Methanoculleus bourgensis TaxID=83986 RepID=A0A8T7H4V2_9EURY|nr:hypothetical protein [Methanoculleus bourgensis]